MPADPTDGQAEADRLRRRAKSLEEVLRAAQAETVGAVSADQSVDARAAGNRLVSLTLTPVASGRSHQELTAAMLEAAQGALRGSALVISEASRTVVSRMGSDS
ncbi:MAG: hypothetical protein QOF92_2223 [Pseudonocardiales bacterium]|jgi:hypothetical protein|nr:hypothetical protein [Pseudonocardiales bacterium]